MGAQDLFKATKPKKPKLAESGFLDPNDKPQSKPKRAVDLRVENDFYATGPTEAILALLTRDGERIQRSGSVWEPACGNGALVLPIREFGMQCVATDIVDRGCPESSISDFFDFKESQGGAMITNPPYNLINGGQSGGRWLRHCLEMEGWDYLALLLGWDWPAAQSNGFAALLDEYPFSWSYLLRWRLDFTGEGSPPQRNAWFVWDRTDVRSYGPDAADPSFRFLDRIDYRQGELL